MSCPAANSIVRMNVSMGSLPDGFCPATLKEFGDAIAARLIVTPNQANSSFASGSIEPSSNQGPWFKNCSELFVWDDATARYIPITKGGFSQNQVFETSGTFVVPDNIYRIAVEIWGAGGGGANENGGGSVGGGGGAGGYGFQFFTVTPSQAITVTVGTGGAGGASGIAGGSSTFSTMTAGGGGGAAQDTGIGWSNPGDGGIVTGANFNIKGGVGRGNAANTRGGSGGDSPNGGQGGEPSLTAARLIGIAPGGGGGGGTQPGLTGGLLPGSGAAGANGRAIIWW